MAESPLEQMLAAIDTLDAEAMMALIAPDGRLLTVDGRQAKGDAAVRELITDFISTLRSATHRITAQWHLDDVWIAEIEATYELADRVRIGPVPRALVLRGGRGGLVEVHAYGVRERQLTEHRTGAEGMRIGGRWIPPL